MELAHLVLLTHSRSLPMPPNVNPAPTVLTAYPLPEIVLPVTQDKNPMLINVILASLISTPMDSLHAHHVILPVLHVTLLTATASLATQEAK